MRDSGVGFVCADMPEANTLTIGIFAIRVQYEQALISEHTKKSLAEKKLQGFKLGTPAMINSLRDTGNSWSSITSILNTSGFTTRIKDFVDIAYLSERFSLKTMVYTFAAQYTQDNPMQALKALNYHNDRL